MAGPQLALKNATDSRLNRAWAGLIEKMRPPSAMSRIEATHDVSARYGLSSSVCCSKTTWRSGIVFHDGKRLPQSSCARPNWLKPAMASMRIRPRSSRLPDRQTEPQIAATGSRPCLTGGSPGTRIVAVATAVGRIDHVIEAEAKPVDPELRVSLAKTGQDDRLLIGPAVAVAITEKPDVRRGRDEHAAEARQHAVRKRQARRQTPSHAHNDRRRRGLPGA